MKLTSYESATPTGTPDLDAVFAALANPTRRALLARLAAGERSVTELAAPFDMSQPAISLHLKVLERAGLVSRGRDAQRRPVRVEAQPLAAASDWLDRYRQTLDRNFRRLDAVLDEMKAADTGGERRSRTGQSRARTRNRSPR
jgi:DNA-binding transcriptional ArsR family regulator